MSQTTHQRITALVSLLPLLQAHVTLGRTTARAQWESTYEPPEPGYVPPPPEPTCNGECSHCGLFLMGRRCGLREVRWAATWLHLRDRYPILHMLEQLLFMLGHHNGRWAAALYRVHVPPWEWAGWDRLLEESLARLGVEWLESQIDSECWLPTHVERVAEATHEADRVAEAGRLRADGCSHDQIRRELHIAKKDVPALLIAFANRNGIS